jgi:hypothetical protein
LGLKVAVLDSDGGIFFTDKAEFDKYEEKASNAR